MTPAPLDNSLPKQLNEQEAYYDIHIRNQKVLRKSQPANNTTKPAGGSNPFDF